MLTTPAPFPYVGSFCLVEHEADTHLARIVFRRRHEVVVSLPLRPDAGGNVALPPDRLIDGTPLTQAEEREFHDLDRRLAGRSPASLRRSTRLKEIAARRDALKGRMMWSGILAHKLLELPFAQRRAA